MSVLMKISLRSRKKDPRPSVPPLHPRTGSIPDETDDAVSDFFREGQNERSLLDDLERRGHSPALASSHLAQVARSAASVFTKDDSLLDQLKQLPRTIALPALCELINQHRSLQHAEIRSAEVYSQVGRVKHRFIVLELSRVSKAPIWLRLDRHRQGSLAGIIFRLGRDLARDEAMLSADKTILVASAKRENRDLFMTNSTLGEFSLFLGVISKELVVYTIWPENCYFFCSLIQQHLDAEGEGEYVQGALPYPALGADVRRRVQEGVRLIYHIPAPFSFAALFETMVCQEEWPHIDELVTILTLLTSRSTSNFELRSRTVGRCSVLGTELAAFLSASRQDDDAMLVFGTIYKTFHALSSWPLLISPESPISSRADIAHFLHSFHSLLSSLDHHGLSLTVSSEAIAVERDLYSVDALMWRQDLAASLRTHCICLRKAGQLEPACDASSESVMLIRMVYLHDRRRHRQSLAGALEQHQATLCEAGRFGDVCDTTAEEVALVRGQPGSDSEGNHQALSINLRRHSIALKAAGRDNDAYDASAESVAIMRSLYEKDPNTSGDALSSALHQHSISLRVIGRYEEALEVGAEGVALRRLLYAVEASKHRESLSTSLEEYGRLLRAAHDEQGAHAASVEAAALKRVLYTSSSAAHRSDFLKSLISEAVVLQDLELFSEALIVATEEVRLDRLAPSEHHATLLSASSLELLRQCDQILSNSLFSKTIDSAETRALRRELCARDPSRYGDRYRPHFIGHLLKLRGRNLIESCEAGADEVSFWGALCQDACEKYQIYLKLALHHWAISLWEAGWFSEACDVGAEDVSLTRVLYAIDNKKWRPDLSYALHRYGIYLRKAGRLSEACDIGAEDVSLKRMLFAVDPEAWRADFSSSLSNCGVSLRQAGRFSEACDAGAEDVSLVRALYETDNKKWRHDLMYALHHYGVALRDAGRFSEACDASAEDVALMRVLFDDDPEAWRGSYSISLNQYGFSLRGAERMREARGVGAEDVSLKRVLYARDPEYWRQEFSYSLNQYGASLRNCGRVTKACDIGLEAVDMSRQVYESDPNDYKKQTEFSNILWDYCLSLRSEDRIQEAMELEEELAAVKRRARHHRGLREG